MPHRHHVCSLLIQVAIKCKILPMALLHPILRYEDQIERIGILKLFTRHLDWPFLESGLKPESFTPLIILLLKAFNLLHPEVHLKI